MEIKINTGKAVQIQLNLEDEGQYRENSKGNRKHQSRDGRTTQKFCKFVG